MAQGPLTMDLAQNMRTGLLELGMFGDEGEHDRQRAAVGGADQGLHLHPQDARLVQAHPNGAPAHSRVGFVIGFHIGQNLV